MSEKPIDSTTKILRKIQADIADFRREVNARLDSIEEYLSGAVVNATEARGIAERLKGRVKRLEDRQ